MINLKMQSPNKANMQIFLDSEQKVSCTINGKKLDNKFECQKVDVTDKINYFSNISQFADSSWEVYNLKKNDRVKLGVNFSPDWTLSGKPTAYLQDNEHFESYDNSVSLIAFPVNYVSVLPNNDYSFRGLFAAHRCNGAVKLEIYDKNKQQINEHVEHISSDFKGGITSDGYQEINISFSTPEGAAYVRPVLVKNITQEGKKDSFVFFTDMYFYQGDEPFAQKIFIDFSKKNTDFINNEAFFYEADVNLADYVLENKSDITIELVGLKDSIIEKATYKRPTLEFTKAACNVEHNIIKGVLPLVEIEKINFNELSLFIDDTLISKCAFEVDKALKLVRFTAFPTEQHLDNRFHNITIYYGPYPILSTMDFLTAQLTPFDALQKYAGNNLPSHLSPLSSMRYKNMQKIMEHIARGEEYPFEINKIGAAHSVLVGGVDKKIRNHEKFTFPKHKQPLVSVIIPVHNKSHLTYYCLCALYFSYNKSSYEVIVVDDGSSDNTQEILKNFANIKIVTHKNAEGFISACNDGAKAAVGKYITLLNNDTEPMCEWIDEAMFAFDNYDNVGAVGSKLIYQDGSLQEAGGIIWNNAEPWNYGRCDNAMNPKYNYTRQSDYISGAALFVRAGLWRDIDGLSREFMPAYYEDTDINFKIREAGYKTLYIPLSVVCHFEGMSNGKDVEGTGLKRFQKINEPKFKKKWIHACRNNGDVGHMPDMQKDRNVIGRALFLDEQTPRPDMDAGSYAAIQEIRLIQSLGFKATLATEGLAYLGEYTHSLQRMGVETLYAPFFTSIDDVLSKRGSEFNIVYVTRYTMAQKYIDLIRQKAPQAKIIFCNADLHFLREMRAAMLQKNNLGLAEALVTRQAELDVMQKVDVILSYNETEHAVLQSHGIHMQSIAKCPWVLDRVGKVNPFENRSHIAFLGGYNHTPNIEAVEFFCKDVMPSLIKKDPTIQFHVFGSSVPESFYKLESDNVKIKGYIGDLSELFQNYRLFISPLLSGAGIKGKVLSSISFGTPSVLSPVSVEATGLSDGYGCKIANKPSEWVEAISSIYHNQELWNKLSQDALGLAEKLYSFDYGQECMVEALEKAGVFASAKPDYLYNKSCNAFLS
jgi:GT2 family glycosyltransferase